MPVPTASLESATAKVRRRLIPFLFLLYVVAYLDRVNIGFAALDMNRDLGFSAAVYGAGSGVFFVTYFLFEVPSNLLLARLGARVWIARIMATWGLVSAGMVLVHDAVTFYALRFALGAAEAGFFPGIIYYLTQWFPARERASAVALFMTATAIAGVIGGPVSGALLLLDGALGLRGWQWLFLIEGLPAVLLAPVVLRWLPDRPTEAHWLTADERDALTRQLAIDMREEPAAHDALRPALRDSRLWVLGLVYGCLVVAFYGISFWLPQMLQGMGHQSSAAVAVMSALPYVAAAIGMTAIGTRSDRTGTHRAHVAWPALLGAVGFVLTALGPVSVPWALGCLSLSAVGIWGALGPFWALPAAFLTGRAAAGGIALINSIGNLGGFVGPSFIGLVRDRTGSFSIGLLTLAGALVIGAALVARLPDPAPRRAREAA